MDFQVETGCIILLITICFNSKNYKCQILLLRTPKTKQVKTDTPGNIHCLLDKLTLELKKIRKTKILLLSEINPNTWKFITYPKMEYEFDLCVKNSGDVEFITTMELHQACAVENTYLFVEIEGESIEPGEKSSFHIFNKHFCKPENTVSGYKVIPTIHSKTIGNLVRGNYKMKLVLNQSVNGQALQICQVMLWAKLGFI